MLSTKFDSTLTLSIPHNSLPPNPLRVHLLEQFDTLSVYRGSLCEQVARARTACSAKLQRLSRHEKSHPIKRINQINSINSTPRPSTLDPRLPTGFRLVKPSQAW